MDIKLFTAIALGKLISTTIKLKGGGATAAPGLYALKIDPNLVKKLNANIKNGSIIISGTNGKTTTARLISELLKSDYGIIHNRQGSNLLRGLASTMINKSSLGGKVPANIAIWEADEAALPQILENTNPKIVILLNLFRDQLDRYGEINTTRTKWQNAIKKLPKTTTLILNADDPNLVYISKKFQGKKIFFGLSGEKINLPQVESIADIKYCPDCNQKLIYKSLYSAHLGSCYCPNGHIKQPKLNVAAKNLNFKKDFSTSFNITTNNEQLTINYQLPGLYNVYNILAASSIAPALQIDSKKISETFRKYIPAFGRFQRIKKDEKEILTFLIKNPAGANEVLRTIATKNNINLLAILNDNIADGRDVSWVWDTNWEILKNKVKKVTTSGTRGYDMALRLKYAGFNLDKNCVYEDINNSIKAEINKLDNNDTLIILPTYTALLSVQKSLNNLGATKWHKD